MGLMSKLGRGMRGLAKYGAATAGIGGAMGAGAGMMREDALGGADMGGAALRGGMEGAKLGPMTVGGMAMAPLFPLGTAAATGAGLAHMEMAGGAGARPTIERQQKLTKMAFEMNMQGVDESTLRQILMANGARPEELPVIYENVRQIMTGQGQGAP